MIVQMYVHRRGGIPPCMLRVCSRPSVADTVHERMKAHPPPRWWFIDTYRACDSAVYYIVNFQLEYWAIFIDTALPPMHALQTKCMGISVVGEEVLWSHTIIRLILLWLRIVKHSAHPAVDILLRCIVEFRSNTQHAKVS